MLVLLCRAVSPELYSRDALIYVGLQWPQRAQSEAKVSFRAGGLGHVILPPATPLFPATPATERVSDVTAHVSSLSWEKYTTPGGDPLWDGSDDLRDRLHHPAVQNGCTKPHNLTQREVMPRRTDIQTERMSYKQR